MANAISLLRYFNKILSLEETRETRVTLKERVVLNIVLTVDRHGIVASLHRRLVDGLRASLLTPFLAVVPLAVPAPASSKLHSCCNCCQ